MIAIADPDGTFLTLSVDEARRLLALMNDEAEDEDLGVNLESLRAQLGEFVG
jgi:hypothetical protein